MALQVRRGTNAERLGITPAEGELISTTDTKQLYVGDGTTAGGITSTAGTIDSLLADTTPQLGGTLDLNNHDITGTGNINITGTIQASGNINLGDGVGSDVINIGGVMSGDLVPNADATHDLGSTTAYWKEAFISQLSVDSQITAERVQADIIADDSTVVFNAATGQIAAAQVSGTFTGNVTGDLLGSVFADDSTAMVDGQNKTFNGYLVGDVTGSVFADDSSPIVDAVGRDIFANDVETFRVTNRTGTLTLREISTANNHRIEITGTKITFKADTSASEIVSQNHDYTINKTDIQPIINLGRIESTGTVGAEESIGRITFSKTDTDGTTTPFQFEVNKTYMTIFPRTTGAADYTKFFKVYNNGKTQVGGEAGGSGYDGMSREPGAQLEVVGNVKISGANELLLGNMTTTERNALTAANGMIIYNTTDNKFQGYENGSWANLI